MTRLAEAKAAVAASRDKDVNTPAVVRDRLEAAESGFMDLASALLRAPDPVPLLRAHAALQRSYTGEQLCGIPINAASTSHALMLLSAAR